MLNKNMKYPQFSKDKDKNGIRCPVYDCFKPFNNNGQLRNHIVRSHKELTDAGIEITSSGKIKWPSNTLNQVLRLVRYYPGFVSKNVLEVGERLLAE